MSIKKEVIHEIMGIEGGYSDDPKDSGGETKYGITRAVALKSRYYGRMRDLPKSKAFSIYEDRYWNKLNLPNIEVLDEGVAREMMDIGVNLGTSRAGEYLQRSLNVLNNNEKYYQDILVDGWVGQQTIGALRAYINKRGAKGAKVLISMLNSLQGTHYIELAERRAKDERFIFGWFLNRVTF